MAQNPLGAAVAGSALACQGILVGWLAGSHPRFVVVADIGQGNCNAVFDDAGRPVIYFDMGGGTRGSLFTRPNPEPTFCLDTAYSLFILSHWDDDHYATLDAHLLAGNLAAIECVAPTQTRGGNTRKRSTTAGYVAHDIGVAGQLQLWRDENPGLPSGNYVATSGEFSVIKVTETDVNNTGLALRLENPAVAGQFILLTGDATFERYLPANPLVNRQTFVHGCNGQCVGLVAGHHGSAVGAPGDIPAPVAGVTSHLIAYSFGWGNQFSHPTAAGVAAYEAAGWSDDHRMDTGGAELAARYAGPRGNVGLVWPGAAPGPAKAPPGALPAQVDAAAVALLAATAAEIGMCRPALPGRERIAVGAAYQAALESDAGNVAGALLAPAGGAALTLVAGAAPPVHGELAAALLAAVAAAGVLAPAPAQQLVAVIVDCVALAAACSAREVAADVRHEIDVQGGNSSDAAKEAYNGANAPEALAAIEAALPTDLVQRAVNAAAVGGPAPTVAQLRTAVAQAVGAAMQARIGLPGGVSPSEQPWQAAATAAAAIAGLARDDLAVAIAAAAGCTPAVPIDPAVAVPATLVDNANAKLLQRVAAAAAIAGPAIGLGVTRTDVACAAAAAARVGLAAACGAPQVGCHRHPRTCPNGPCSLSVHYFHGMFPARIRTVAGSAAVVHGGDGGPATAAGFTDPRHVLQDRGFALYVSDTGAHRIRRIGTDGNIATLAGTVAGAGYGGDANGLATAAQFDALSAVALDRFRNQLYVADAARNRVRRIDLSLGQVTAVAGTGMAAHGGDGGPATAAQLDAPRGLAYDDTGHALYIADTGNDCVRRVDLATGVISTVAGIPGNAGDGPDGPAAACQLDGPRGLACAAGSLFIADTGNHQIRELRFGQVTSIAGTGAPGFGGNNVPATGAVLNQPWDVAIGTDVNGDQTIVIADTGNNRVREIRANGTIATLAGPGGLAHPAAVASDDAGDVYIAYDAAHCVRRYDRALGGAPAVFAGTAGAAGHAGNGAPATGGNLSGPIGLACGPSLLFVADAGNRRVRSVQVAGPHQLAAVAGSGNQGNAGDAVNVAANAQLNTPGGLGYDPVAHALYFADSASHCVRRIDLATGIIFRVAGQPLAGAGPGGDLGPAIAAQLSNPSDVFFDGVENVLYIADTGNNKIRAVSLATGIITTLAGTGGGAWAGDGAGAAFAQLNAPVCVTADANGIVYAGTSDHRVRRIALDVPRTITTWAGNGVAGAAGDGLAAANPAVQLNNPAGLAADNAGNLYLSCAGSSSVRLVRWDGSLITTIAGTPPAGFGGDGGPPDQAHLNGPRGIHVDEAGRNLFIADAVNHRIRRACL